MQVGLAYHLQNTRLGVEHGLIRQRKLLGGRLFACLRNLDQRNMSHRLTSGRKLVLRLQIFDKISDVERIKNFNILIFFGVIVAGDL